MQRRRVYVRRCIRNDVCNTVARALAAPALALATAGALSAAALTLTAAALAAAALAYPVAAAVHASADVVCQHVCAGPEWRLPGRWTKLVH
jgi:hypothetical protein